MGTRFWLAEIGERHSCANTVERFAKVGRIGDTQNTMFTPEIIRVLVALFIGVYWLYTATVGWERYMSLNPRWIRRRWLAAVVAVVALAVGVNWLIQALGTP